MSIFFSETWRLYVYGVLKKYPVKNYFAISRDQEIPSEFFEKKFRGRRGGYLNQWIHSAIAVMEILMRKQCSAYPIKIFSKIMGAEEGKNIFLKIGEFNVKHLF